MRSWLLTAVIVGVIVSLTSLASASLLHEGSSHSDTNDDCFGKHLSDSERIQGCSRIIISEPGNAAAYNRRGVAYFNNGDYDHALADLSKRIELDSKNPEAYNNRGIVYDHKGDYTPALLDFNKAIALDPKYFGAYFNRGNVWFDKQNYPRALKDYETGIRLAPEASDGYYARGNVYLNTGDYDRAIRDYNRAIELDDENGAAFNNRGAAYFAKGGFDEARRDFNKALGVKPDALNAIKGLASVYFYEGEYDRAIEKYERAIALDPDDAYLPLHRYLAEVKAGKEVRAGLAASARKTGNIWPGPVYEFFLGNISAAKLEAAAQSQNERCAFSYFLGEWDMLKGEQKTARPLLKKATEVCPKDVPEYPVAAAELRRLGP